MKTYNRFTFSNETTLLDVGACDAYLAISAVKLGFVPYSIAIENNFEFAEMCDACVELTGMSERVAVVRQDVLDYEVMADAVLCMSVLQWVEDPLPILRKCMSLCGSTLVLELWLDELPEGVGSHYHAHSRETIFNELWAGGFCLVRELGKSGNGRDMIQAHRWLGDVKAEPHGVLDMDNPVGRISGCGVTWTAFDRSGNRKFLKLQTRNNDNVQAIYKVGHRSLVPTEFIKPSGIQDEHLFHLQDWRELGMWKPGKRNNQQATEAVTWLHEQGFVHLDVADYHLKRDGCIKLIDHGSLTKIGDPIGYWRVREWTDEGQNAYTPAVPEFDLIDLRRFTDAHCS